MGRSDDATDGQSLAAAGRPRAEGTTIFAMGLGEGVDAAFMQRLAGSPDRLRLAPDSADLRGIYGEVARTILCQR